MIIKAAIQFLKWIFNAIHFKRNRQDVDSIGFETSQQNLHSKARNTERGHQTKVSVNAAKYLGRLSPELYHQVVNRCRIHANRHENLITEEMVRNVIKSLYNDPNASEGLVNAKRRTG